MTVSISGGKSGTGDVSQAGAMPLVRTAETTGLVGASAALSL
jgi:hypothetical protein